MRSGLEGLRINLQIIYFANSFSSWIKAARLAHFAFVSVGYHCGLFYGRRLRGSLIVWICHPGYFAPRSGFRSFQISPMITVTALKGTDNEDQGRARAQRLQSGDISPKANEDRDCDYQGSISDSLMALWIDFR